MTVLTFIYWEGGYGVEKDNKKALYYADLALNKALQHTDEYTRAAEDLIGQLLTFISTHFKEPENQEAVINLYNKVLSFKSPANKCLVLNKLGVIYHDGKNFEQALRYFEMGSYTTECGGSLGADSLGWLGRMYFMGRGVQKDTAKAFELLEDTDKLGSKVATNTLCSIYANGYEVKRNLGKAIPYCERVKIAGIDNVLGRLYYFAGQYDKALPRLKKVLDSTHDPDAANVVSHMYINGLGVEQDLVTAREWAKRAGEFEQSLIGLIETDHVERAQMLEHVTEKLKEEMKKAPNEYHFVRGNLATDSLHLGGLMGLGAEEEQSLFGWDPTQTGG